MTYHAVPRTISCPPRNKSRWPHFLSVALLTACAATGFASSLPWFTSVEEAQKKARLDNKFLLLFFTESDFCGVCDKMKSEVFDPPEFAAFADVNLVMVQLDFPHEKPQDPGEKKMNRQIAQTLHIDTFPQVVVLDQNGKYMAQGGYAEGGAKGYIADLEKVPGMKHVDLDNLNLAAWTQPDPPHKPAAFVPVAPAAPVRYEQLALKAISGGKDRRFAMINNETFRVGDTAKVKVQDLKIQVTCKEIREDSVLITADGKPMELKLGRQSK
jgi:thioredoxin-related protein